MRSTDVGHSGFIVDAQAMAALLYDFATRADYRALVKKEFDGSRRSTTSTSIASEGRT